MNNQDISLGGNIWQQSKVDEGAVERMALAYNLPQHLARLLCVRGVHLMRLIIL